MRTGFVKDSLSEDLRRETGLWMRTFVEIGVSNGRGLSEIVGLRVEQVDFEANATGREPGTTKNKEGREVLLAPCAPVGQCCHGKQPTDRLLTRYDGSDVKRPQKGWHRASRSVWACGAAARPRAPPEVAACGTNH